MSKIDQIINIVRSLREEGVPTNNASSGNISGLPPDQPPVYGKKRIYLGKGSRKSWMKNSP